MIPTQHIKAEQLIREPSLKIVFNEITLSQIALDLDKKEKELMMEQGMTKDFLKFMGEDSGNVAM